MAYVDDSTSEEIATQKGTPTKPGAANAYRGRSVDENLRMFVEMKEGKYKRTESPAYDRDSPLRARFGRLLADETQATGELLVVRKQDGGARQKREARWGGNVRSGEKSAGNHARDSDSDANVATGSVREHP